MGRYAWRGNRACASVQETLDDPIVDLSNEMLATFLRQRIALRLVVPEAQKRLDSGFVDGTELYDEELAESLRKAIPTK